MVTQTVEVMHQTEMIQTLIDTYADKSGMKYVLNHSQIMPNIDFPPENTADLLNEQKFTKPFWFVRPKETKFTRGDFQPIPKISKPIVELCIRKSLCGLLKMCDYFESHESALILFQDSVDLFYKSLMENLNETLLFHQPDPNTASSSSTEPIPNDRNRKLNIAILGKAYYSMTSESLLNLHNYYKNSIVNKNAEEIDEFNEIFQEYKKLQQESQNLHRSATFMKDEDYMSYMDFGNSGQSDSQHFTNQSNLSSSQENINQIMNYLDGGEIIEPGLEQFNSIE